MIHSARKQTDAPSLAITVETTPGGRWLAHAQGRSLAFERMPGSPDGEPVVLDEHLGEFAEMAQPLNIRATIKSLRAEDQNFNPLGILTHSVKNDGSPARGRPATKYLLTEVEAIYVLMHLRTEKARACKWMFAQMVAAVRRGSVTRAANDVEAPSPQVAALEAKVDRLIAALALGTYPHGLLGKAEAARVLAAVREVADCYCSRKTKPWSSKRKEIELEVKRAARWNDRALEMQRPDGLTDAWQKLVELTAEGRAYLKGRQPSLPFGGN